MIRATVLAILAAIAVSALFSTTASADRSYHSERLELNATGLAGHPELRSGQVVNIHPNGPNNGALERYMVNGAAANADYRVVLVIAELCNSDGSLGGAPVTELTSDLIETDRNGNGTGSLLITRDDLDDFQGFVGGVKWELRVGDVGGAPAYDTNCTTVTVD